MPQATTLRLVRRSQASAPTLSATALSLVQQHASHTHRVHSLASTIAADTDALIEALRYFVVAPPQRCA